MDIEVYTFPTMDNPKAVEVAYCELLSAQRRGESIPVEALDWMDSANTWLIEARGAIT